MQKKSEKIGILDKLSIAFFAMFLISQVFKVYLERLVAIPVDVTLLLAVLSIATFVLTVFLGRRFKQYQFVSSLLVFLALFFMPLLYLLYADFTDEYTVKKATGMFTFTLFSAIFPIFLIDTVGKLKLFLRLLMYAMLGSVGLNVYNAVTSGALETAGFRGNTDEDGAFSANVILVSRAAAGAALIAFLQLRARDPFESKLVSIAIICIAITSALLTASRGPFFGLLIIIVLFKSSNISALEASARKVLLLAVVASIAYFALPTVMSFIPEESQQKIIDTDAGLRDPMLREGVDIFIENPIGVGIGQYSKYSILANEHELSYIHNVPAEYFIETGVIGGLAYAVFFIYLILSHKPKKEYSDAYTQVFLVMLFFLLQSFLSADMNGNRQLFSLAALCLVRPYLFGRQVKSRSNKPISVRKTRVRKRRRRVSKAQ